MFRTLFLIALIVGVVVGSAVAFAKVIHPKWMCGPYFAYTMKFGDAYPERQVVGQATNGWKIELWISPDDQKWMQLEVRSDNHTCVEAFGTAGEPLPSLPPSGSPMSQP